MSRHLLHGAPGAYTQPAESMIASCRLGEPSDLVGMAVFPASADSGLIAGRTFNVDCDAFSAEHILNEDRAAPGLPAARESERPSSCVAHVTDSRTSMNEGISYD